MTIAKRLTDLVGGSIEVESEIGKGTKFTVAIPHRIASEADVCNNNQTEKIPENFPKKRILIAEDNDLNSEIAEELLTEMGFEVEWAPDGDICVSMVKQAKKGYYDLILMDIQMPNMNGYQTAEAIRSIDDPSKSGIPIIAMTANTFEEDKNNAFAAGMDAHLAKPIDVQKLTEALKSFFIE